MCSGTALAQSADPLSPLPNLPSPIPPTAAPPVAAPAPQPVTPAVVVPRDWRGVFDAIYAGNWASARAGIATLPANILTPVALAELYTARGSPTVDAGSLQSLMAQAPDLPQAAQLAAMAVRRGAVTTPPIVQPKRLINLGSAPVRYRTRPVTGDPAADQLRTALEPYVDANDAAGAEAQLLTYVPTMTLEGRAEAAQRVAWIYYVNGDDANSRRVADTWRQGAQGDWASNAAWISGLASWRLGDCEAASRAFNQVAATSQQRELRTGALYWAARSEQACRRPRSVAPLLKAAATNAESFYGLLARETLGMDTRLPADPHVHRDPPIDHLPNVQRAKELAAMGHAALAEEFLRHQAKIGAPGEHHALIQLAKRLDLPAAQLWLANNGQWGAVADAADRYPNPRWSPLNGWRVDPALAFGHIVQESSFRRAAVSPADAVGLMQVRPGTAQDIARARGLPYSRGSLTNPIYNLEYGQSFIEMMRRHSATAGQLPRVIASYNSGPLPVGRWAAINDKGDPLLWIESIPYWETRYYVPAVLRNMWVYQGLNRQPTPTLKAMAEHHWPAFPTGQTQLSH
ncbi:lytic transglycosylase domain-containing protein [Sphingomonas lutea]|uniref:lytic transglycosylase domain-containing protein n=1 Tax=Sphingomonas lutea TaxID=1045317 RepID=UPI001F22855C|nr:lytic transglycosylase domain-containing protein [Sphingomonas lutea]